MKKIFISLFLATLVLSAWAAPLEKVQVNYAEPSLYDIPVSANRVYQVYLTDGKLGYSGDFFRTMVSQRYFSGRYQVIKQDVFTLVDISSVKEKAKVMEEIYEKAAKENVDTIMLLTFDKSDASVSDRYVNFEQTFTKPDKSAYTVKFCNPLKEMNLFLIARFSLIDAKSGISFYSKYLTRKEVFHMYEDSFIDNTSIILDYVDKGKEDLPKGKAKINGDEAKLLNKVKNFPATGKIIEDFFGQLFSTTIKDYVPYEETVTLVISKHGKLAFAKTFAEQVKGKNYAAALETLKGGEAEVIALNKPAETEIFYANYAILCELLGDFENALVFFDKAEQVNPKKFAFDKDLARLKRRLNLKTNFPDVK